jgi:hypothetical protein
MTIEKESKGREKTEGLKNGMKEDRKMEEEEDKKGKEER